MSRFAAVISIVLAVIAAFAQTDARANPFSNWVAVVIAGDWQQHKAPSWSFDDARRDVAKQLVALGFDPAHIRQFSSQPQWFPDENPPETGVHTVRRALGDMVGEGGTGCLFYLSTHGRPDGTAYFGGDYHLAPGELKDLLDTACGTRPTIVVISACYSGAFIPALQAPNRMVLTAARADRVSFRCGARKYPEFDGCFLEAAPAAPDFLALANATRDCVSRREREGRIAPGSEPQLFVGAEVEPLLRAATFR